MVNFMCHLDWAKGCPVNNGETSFPNVSVRVFLEEVSVWIRRLNKDPSYQRGWASSNPLRNCTEQRRKGEFALCLRWDSHLLLSLDISAPGSHTGTDLYNLVLHVTDSRSWDFSAFISSWAHPYNKSYIYISYWFCFSREPWLILIPYIGKVNRIFLLFFIYLDLFFIEVTLACNII